MSDSNAGPGEPADAGGPGPRASSPSAGWYPDPLGTEALRYWTGTAWSAGPAATRSAATPVAVAGGPAGGWLSGRWPERDLSPQPAVVLGAVGLGAWAALTWPERKVGLAVALTLLAAVALMWSVARFRRDPWTVACTALAAVLATTAMIRDAFGVIALSVVVAGVVLAAGLTRARTVTSVPLSVAAWPLSTVRGLRLLTRTISATSRKSVVWPVLRTVGLSLIALGVFGWLLASGDAVFGSWAESLVPDLSWDGLRTFVLVLVAWIVLSGAYLALNPPAVADVGPSGRRESRPWEWAVPVGLVIALIAGFLVAQAAAMWGGPDYVQRTTGLTYAEYVHQGFGQLTAVTSLTVLVVALTLRVAAQETRRDRLLLRGLLGTLCALTLAVVASALHRMSLYQDAFGYTVLRVYVDGFELWLGLIILMLLAAGIRLSGRWLGRAVLVSGAVFTIGFAAMNPHAWVADRNIDRFEAGRTLDTMYLATLSADATPTIVERLPTHVASCIVNARSYYNEDDGWYYEDDGLAMSDDLLAWNLGRSRAQAAIDRTGTATSDQPGDCDDVIRNDYRG